MEAPLHHFLRIQNCLDQTRKKPSHPAVSSHRRGQWGLEGTGRGGTDIGILGYSLADVPPFLGGLGLTPRSQAPGPGRLLSSRRRTAVPGDRGLALPTWFRSH